MISHCARRDGGRRGAGGVRLLYFLSQTCVSRSWNGTGGMEGKSRDLIHCVSPIGNDHKYHSSKSRTPACIKPITFITFITFIILEYINHRSIQILACIKPITFITFIIH